MNLEHDRFMEMDALREKLTAKVQEAINREHHVGNLALGYLRYEALRKLSPAAFQELGRRNIAGEHFDSMIDLLITTS